jgi:hypothetical protein
MRTSQFVVLEFTRRPEDFGGGVARARRARVEQLQRGRPALFGRRQSPTDGQPDGRPASTTRRAVVPLIARSSHPEPRPPHPDRPHARTQRGRARAIALFSEMAGALLLSRAVADADPALADEILESARTDLHTRTGAARSQALRQVARRPRRVAALHAARPVRCQNSAPGCDLHVRPPSGRRMISSHGCRNPLLDHGRILRWLTLFSRPKRALISEVLTVRREVTVRRRQVGPPRSPSGHGACTPWRPPAWPPASFPSAGGPINCPTSMSRAASSG